MKNTIVTILIGILFFTGTTKAQKHPDFTITHQCKVSPVKSQGLTGTCWAYTTTSFLESEILRKTGKEYDLSEMYIVRNVYPYKAERNIRFHGHSNFDEGGQAHDAIRALRFFGIVPENVYKGKMYDGEYHSHNEMITALKPLVKRFAESKKEISDNWMTHFEAILNGFMGSPPENFSYEGSQYTPKNFIEKNQINPDDYIEFTSYNHHPFYKAFVLEVPDNWAHELYYNLPADEFVELMKTALEKGYTIAWDGDVSGKGFSHSKGKAVLLHSEKKMLQEKGNQQVRQELFNSFSTTDDHLMHITGLAKDKKGGIWFQTKNSWSCNSNKYGGYLYLSEDYIKCMTVAFMVNKEAIPNKLKKKLGL